MLEEIKFAATRNPALLAADFAGASALLVLLMAGLVLPALF